MNALGLLAIRLQIDQPGWPLWGPVVPRNPRPAMPVKLPRRMRKLLCRYAPWIKPALLLNVMWGRLLSSINVKPEDTVALAGFIHNLAVAILNGSWDPRGEHVLREFYVWQEVRDSFLPVGPYTGP